MNLIPTLLALVLTSDPAAKSAADVRLESVLVTVIEQVEIPAQEPGVLARIQVREGAVVKEGDLLAQIDDSDAQLVGRRARLELDVARKTAQNDADVRLSKKQLQLAQSELSRAKESVERFKKSVSAAELETLQFQTEKAALAIEHAEHEFDLAQLAPRLKENEVAVADRGVARRQIVSPIDGVVVQIKRRRGEWVQPGETVIRVVRMDRLRVEGFVPTQVAAVLAQRPVTLHIGPAGSEAGGGGAGDDATEESGIGDFKGEIVFVNPEIDPVNGQVRIWAEVENRGQLLRPGMAGSLVIHAAAEPETAQDP